MHIFKETLKWERYNNNTNPSDKIFTREKLSFLHFWIRENTAIEISLHIGKLPLSCKDHLDSSYSNAFVEIQHFLDSSTDHIGENARLPCKEPFFMKSAFWVEVVGKGYMLLT